MMACSSAWFINLRWGARTKSIERQALTADLVRPLPEWSDQPAILSFGAPIAAIGDLKEPLPIDHDHNSATGPDGRCPFQGVERDRDTGAPYGEHHA